MFFLLQTFDFSIFKEDLRFWTSQSDKKKNNYDSQYQKKFINSTQMP